jgi:parallel beta-helix repeat protein
MTYIKGLAVVSLAAGVLMWSGLNVAYAASVNCNTPNASVQEAVNNADGPTTINIKGDCVGDVTITKDDITLSGKKGGSACNKADPSVSAGATIDGTITVDGVRATIEFLEITGAGDGVDITNRATVRLTCNDISGNEANGVSVMRSSNAVLRDNTLSGNGTRTTNISIFWDCGLSASGGSSVQSEGNTYKNNQYCAIDIFRQSEFRNGAFLPRDPDGSHPADPDERDVFTELGCDPTSGSGCLTNDLGPVAIDVYTGGSVDLRNADVNGETTVSVLSLFRVEDEAAVQGNIDNSKGCMVRIRHRSSLSDRIVTYTGTLSCSDTSQTFGSSVQCGQTCSGAIPDSCTGP